MARPPFLSVIMPTYNGERYLAAALDSLVAQRDGGLEVVAIDDGSIDRTVQILESYANRLALKILTREHTGNWVIGMNRGLESATGTFASLLHQDDIWLPGRLRRIRTALAMADTPALLVHPIWFIGPDGRRSGALRCPLPAKRLLEPGFVTPRLLVQNFVPVLGTVFPRKFAIDAGGVDEELWYTADWDLWLRLAAMGPTWHVPKRLAAYRIHPHTQTFTRSEQLSDFRLQLERVLSRHLKKATPRGIESVARFSVDVNVSLAALYHGRRASIASLLTKFVTLGPLGWWRYLRYSRIVERTGSRLRVRLRHSQ